MHCVAPSGGAQEVVRQVAADSPVARARRRGAATDGHGQRDMQRDVAYSRGRLEGRMHLVSWAVAVAAGEVEAAAALATGCEGNSSEMSIKMSSASALFPEKEERDDEHSL